MFTHTHTHIPFIIIYIVILYTHIYTYLYIVKSRQNGDLYLVNKLLKNKQTHTYLGHVKQCKKKQ